MAYSSIGNVGYVLLGLAAGNERGVQAVVFYLAIYMVMTLGVFAVILAMRRRGIMVEGVPDLAGLGKDHPDAGAGHADLHVLDGRIPPLAGFWGKLYIFMAGPSRPSCSGRPFSACSLRSSRPITTCASSR